MGNQPSPMSVRRLSVVIVLVVVVGVYSFPYLATTVALKSKLVPFSFAADLPLYLNLSKIGSSNLNPYFGTILRSGEVGYTTFDMAFKLLSFVTKIVGNDLWWAVLVWNLFWWTTMFVGALWFLRVAFPEETGLNLCLATTLLFFFNFGVMKSMLLAWLHLPSLAGFDGLTLPYIRTVFPQIPVALLFFYLALQVRALHSYRWYDWMGMCFLQAIAFSIFPYATLMMAGTTLVAVLAGLALPIELTRLRTVVAYGAACALIDIAFLLSRLPGRTQHSSLALIGFQPSRAVGLVGGMLLLLVLLTVATAISPPAGSRGTKLTIVGLGFANALLMLGDTVFSPALLVSHHGGYFMHATISLQIVYLVAAAFVRFGRGSLWLRAACLTTIVFTTTNGLLLAYVDYRYALRENRDANELAQAFRSLNVTKEDLVIARAQSVDDSCSWVPLLTPARVLFCRSAQYKLSTEEKRSLYRLRQSFYLYFTGKDSRWVEQAATGSGDIKDLERLAFSGEIDTADKERWDQAKTAIRTDLVPLLSQVEQRNNRVLSFFSPYKQVLVVDDVRNPTFVRQRLSLYFSIESETRIDGLVLLWCRPP